MTIPRSNSMALTGRFRQERFRRARAQRMCRIDRKAVIHYSPGLQPWVGGLPSGALKVAPDVSATHGINTSLPEQPPRSPLSGRFDYWPDPGLKPWAMFYGRSAAKSDRRLGGSVRRFHGQATRPRSLLPLTDH
jgi:hypothetical protein